jgi:hypothetical protein
VRPLGRTQGERTVNEQRDAAILTSLPRDGRIVLATLLAEGWEALQARDYHVLRTLCGAASAPVRAVSSRDDSPVIRGCGMPSTTGARRGSARDPRSRAKYTLRQRGHSHARALRSVGDRPLNVPCAMLRNGTQFNPSLQSQKSGCEWVGSSPWSQHSLRVAPATRTSGRMSLEIASAVLGA